MHLEQAPLPSYLETLAMYEDILVVKTWEVLLAGSKLSLRTVAYTNVKSHLSLGWGIFGTSLFLG